MDSKLLDATGGGPRERCVVVELDALEERRIDRDEPLCLRNRGERLCLVSEDHGRLELANPVTLGAERELGIGDQILVGHDR